MTITKTPSLPILKVAEIGEYIRHASCERRFRLEVNNRSLAKTLPFADRLFNALDPVLQEAGRKREAGWEATLQDGGFHDLSCHSTKPANSKHTTWVEFASNLSNLAKGQEAYGREIEVSAKVGAFEIEGRVDFVLLRWRNGHPVLRLVECKASRRDRTYHRIQVAIYQKMIRALLNSSPVVIAGFPVHPDDVECVVARIDEATNESQEILDLKSLELGMEETDVDRLLAVDGDLCRIATSELGDLPYQLDAKCDGCVFNVHCLSESGRMRRIELLGVPPSVVRAFSVEGINTLDDLCELDLKSEVAKRIRVREGFGERVDELVKKAAARRQTLPGGKADPDSYEVARLPNSGDGQLPAHEISGSRLIRVYLAVDYDYSENRIGALSAHVTASDWRLHTTFEKVDGKWKPDPKVVERGPRDHSGGHPTRELQGNEVIHFASSEWSGHYETDTGFEIGLIQSFFRDVVDAIADVAQTDEAPVHFYVWSRSEMVRLVEACTRAGSRLLSNLRQLLGCRESLEQLLYSSLKEEIDQRFALGWSGRGLAVISSLKWFGRQYHWTRMVAGRERSIDHEFAQDIFDFKTDLQLNESGNWATSGKDAGSRHKFEIRSRFHDSLTAPYWRAHWNTLPSTDNDQGLTPQVANAIRRYNRAAKPGVLREYLRARTHALRWLEEGVGFRNNRIEKPPLKIEDLTNFQLGVDNASQASIDFLRLDQHIKVSDWLAKHLVPPINRIPTGKTLPVSNVFGRGKNVLTAKINLDEFEITLDILQARCSFGEGSFVRLSPCAKDPSRGQTFKQLMRGGRTCRISSLNWTTGEIELDLFPAAARTYSLFSAPAQEMGEVYDFATIDENVTDFVANRVEARLRSTVGHHALRWFDPLGPEIPQLSAPAKASELEALVKTLSVAADMPLTADQAFAASSGLATRVQLLQGPPGTGKTTTTSAATLLRILARRKHGDIIIVAAQTHTAVDTLLVRIDEMLDGFTTHANSQGMNLPNVVVAKVHSSQVPKEESGRIKNFLSNPSAQFVNQNRKDAVLIVGGTTSAVLKLAAELSERQSWRDELFKFQVPMLVVDEASMMVFPHFLSLATLVNADGEILLTGDHRQLAPIVSHDWDTEDRPPTIVYQPFASAFQAVANIIRREDVADGSALKSALNFTFRLPPTIRGLIARIYRRDDINLQGLPMQEDELANGSGEEAVWSGKTGLYLVVHDERSSRQSNQLEVELVERFLKKAPFLADRSVALMTPHRAQRSLLKVRLGGFGTAVDVIDTVERMQGGERPTVIYSATVSDPAEISASAEFVLDLNRSNVAFSRAQNRLIVVCSRSLLDHVPTEVEHYKSALLWKSLRALCSQELSHFEINGHSVRVLTPCPEDVSVGVSNFE